MKRKYLRRIKIFRRMSTFETVFWERNFHQLNTIVILFRCLFSVNVCRLSRLRGGDIYLILSRADYHSYEKALSSVSYTLIDHTPASHTWAGLAITHAKKHWARSVISRSIISEPSWLSLIRGSTELDQSYLDRSYLSRTDYHSYGGALSSGSHISVGHTWAGLNITHSREH